MQKQQLYPTAREVQKKKKPHECHFQAARVTLMLKWHASRWHHFWSTLVNTAEEKFCSCAFSFKKKKSLQGEKYSNLTKPVEADNTLHTAWKIFYTISTTRHMLGWCAGVRQTCRPSLKQIFPDRVKHVSEVTHINSSQTTWAGIGL